MQSTNINLKKITLIVLPILVLLFVAIWVFSTITTQTIRVHSDSDAILYAATKQDGEWVQIGIGTATYSTKEDSPIFFQAIRGESISQIVVDPTNAPEESIEIKTETLSLNPSKIFEGPLTSPFVEDKILYGINSTTYSIISANLERFDPSTPKYIGLPYLENIVWRNSNNFFYRTYSGDVGVFSGGKDRGYSYFGSKGPIIDIARFNDKPIAFLSVDSIYLTPDFNRELTKIAEANSGELYYFNTDENYVYYATFAHPGDYASDAELGESSETSNGPDSSLKILDYSGNVVVDSSLGNMPGISGVSSVGGNQNEFVVSSDYGLSFIDNSSEGVDHRLIYSSKSEGVISVSNNVYLFMPDGIWRYDKQVATTTLAVNFDDEQYLVPNSIIKSPDSNSVTYTLSGKDSGVYELEL